jgi:glutamyl-tRNA synthetase
MFDALGAPVPRLAHGALLTGADAALSKRLGSEGVDGWRAAGIEALAVTALLARLGTSLPVEAVGDLADLVPGFDLASFGRAPPRFDPAELAAVNARTLHLLSFAAVAARLPADMTEAGWDAVRGNLATLSEAADWQTVITGPIAPVIAAEDRDFLALAATTLAALPWGDDIWARFIAALKPQTDRKGRTLFAPLRLALTGRDHGPEMAALLPLIGREACLQRLQG